MHRHTALIPLMLAACVDNAPLEPAPLVRLVVVDDDYEPAPAKAEYLDGARAWEPLGFTVEIEDGTFPRGECPRRWYAERVTDCQITIGVVVTDGLVESRGTDAYSNRTDRATYIDARLVGENLQRAVAHEVGHILLDASNADHTRTGIMAGHTTEMSDDDRDLACRNINICL